MKVEGHGQNRLPGDKKGHLPAPSPAIRQPKPWEDEWFNPLPDDQIKKLSLRWSPAQWEEYLLSLEGNLKEKLGKKLDVKARVELFESRGDEEFQKNAEQDVAEAHAMEAEQTHYLKPPVILEAEEKALEAVVEATDEEERRQAAVRYALEFLTVNERFVIQKYYWEGKSEPAIARMMRKSRPTVQTWKTRALTKIYEVLSSVLPISEGTALSPSPYKHPKPSSLPGLPRKMARLEAFAPVGTPPIKQGSPGQFLKNS